MDLGLHHGRALGQLGQRVDDFLGGGGRGALGDGHTVLFEEGLGLVLVNVHGGDGVSHELPGDGTPKSALLPASTILATHAAVLFRLLILPVLPRKHHPEGDAPGRGLFRV